MKKIFTIILMTLYLTAFPQKKEIIYLWPGKVPGEMKDVMASSLRNAKLPVELHLLPEGGHGYGVRHGKVAARVWPELAEDWLSRTLKAN